MRSTYVWSGRFPETTVGQMESQIRTADSVRVLPQLAHSDANPFSRTWTEYSDRPARTENPHHFTRTGYIDSSAHATANPLSRTKTEHVEWPPYTEPPQTLTR